MSGGYAARAHHYAAEIRAVPPPAALADLLRPGLRVAEIPSGTGHFLPAYSAARVNLTLIDACAAMLTAAQHQAAALGAQPRMIHALVEDLPGDAGPFDLVVMPNAALNQLAAASDPTVLIASVARILTPGGLLLAQILDPTARRTCGFYDPALESDTWHVDRQFTDETGRRMVRRRRQHRQAGQIDIDLEMHHGRDRVYHQRLTLLLLNAADLHPLLLAAGLTDPRLQPGAGGLIDLLTTRTTGQP